MSGGADRSRRTIRCGRRPAARLLLALAALATCGAAPAAWASAAPGQSEVRGTALEQGSRRPLTGAIATLHCESEKGLTFLTSTDPAGRFVFHGLPPGAYSLEVSLAGYRTGHKGALDVRPPFRSIIEVLLEAGADPGSSVPDAGADAAPPAAAGEAAAADATLTVMLLNREQQPVPEGVVALVPVAGEGDRRFARSDAGGRVEFGSVPARRYRLTVSAPGFLSVRTEKLVLGGAPAERVAVILTPYPLDFAGSLEDLLPPEEPLPPARPVEVQPR